MKPFSLLIKPASADCNLHCSYCFYYDHYKFYPEEKNHRMNNTVLEKLISSYLSTPQPVYSFNWQGGEPTLMGIDFFRKAIHLQQKYAKEKDYITNSVQTNGTLLDEKLVRHFARYNYLVGVSLDGPGYIHDYYRKYHNGSGSFDKVIEGIKKLKKYNVNMNVLILVNDKNVRKAGEVYQFMKENNLYYQQYIPCVEFDKTGKPLPWTISGEEWGDFLCELFDQWYKNDITIVSIRIFDAILNYLVHGIYTLCTMGKNCNQYFVVEYNGDIYPCDFFVEKELRVGNILKSSWKELQESKVYKEFGNYKTKWNKLCKNCPYLEYCNGDCLKHRMYGGNNPSNLSWLCKGWKKFYKHSLPYFEKFARKIKNDIKNQTSNKMRY